MKIPSWLRGYLQPNEAETVVEAIRQAEATTAGELVPMIVRRSSTIGHVPVILFSLLALLFFVVDGPTWQAEFLGDHALWYLLDLALLIAITAVGARLPWVQRLLTTRTDQAAQVEARAVIEFYASNIQRTKDATGILIFVSLMERRAVVLADSAVSNPLPPETWREVCDQLVTGIKKKSLGHALGDAVRRCGEIMAPLFPIQPDDENELLDELIIKE